MEVDTKINMIAIPPVMSQAQFAAFVGKDEKTIRSWVITRAVPTIKMGGSRLINLEKFRTDLAAGKDEFVKGDYDDV
ncbi:DNA-binding protein [uncultured Porticoccus sp.]|uniref:DNA-binding protein n=1 Tax=uncultured Porticoccus sp. TaxID=1256050 RepID=UPI0026324F42|nr:DNA-binding protein [uncultured Porticoccus sp.]